MRVAARFAYAAAVLFALHLITYFIPALRDATLATAPAIAIAVAVLAIAQHVVVFPVVATLPSVGWARIAAYTWLIGDMISDLMQAGGASKSLYLTLRLIVNVLAALWIAAASAPAEGRVKAIGYIVAGLLLAYSLASTLTPNAFILALPALVLLPLWFALMGRRLDRPVAPESTAPTAASPN
ncbi:MAG TPA: hypothetical protein VF812_03230 [Ktedonobacterales bacterium]